MRDTLGTIAIEVLKEEKCHYLDLGEFGLLDEIYDRAVKRGIIRKKKTHPLDIQAYTISQLRKSKLFKVYGYIDYPGFGRAYSRCVVLTPVEIDWSVA